MKTYSCLLILFLFPLFSISSIVTPERAAKAAVSFYEARYSYFGISGEPANVSIKAIEPKTGEDSRVCYYVVSMQSGGFVLISGNDCVMPVLGYSFTGTFGGIFNFIKQAALTEKLIKLDQITIHSSDKRGAYKMRTKDVIFTATIIGFKQSSYAMQDSKKANVK